MASAITGKIETILAGTSARAILFESYDGPKFQTGGTVVVNTQTTVTTGSDGTFTVTLEPGAYRVVVSDAWKRSVWLIQVPSDGLTHDIVSIRVTSVSTLPDTYYTAAEVDALIAAAVAAASGGIASGVINPVGSPGTNKFYLRTDTGQVWYSDGAAWQPLLV